MLNDGVGDGWKCDDDDDDDLRLLNLSLPGMTSLISIEKSPPPLRRIKSNSNAQCLVIIEAIIHPP